ncbi:hypothetical protein [Streptomyces sp. NPDC059928]|uniref:hypothetical protein n=1 Tax=unclassified Streptomyces TaxID=2593676 RepID=UPI0036646B10
MSPIREVYYYDYTEDFGLSGLARKLCSRVTLRLDLPVVLALAEAIEDDRLDTDVRLLLDSPLPEEVIHRVWLAAVRRCFDPLSEGMEMHTWLLRVSAACPPRTEALDPAETRVLDEARPVVAEAELRTVVAMEIDQVAAGLDRAVAVPGIAGALRRIVDHADADLGFRMFLRAIKAYSLPLENEQYERLLAIGERLAYPAGAVYDDLNVRWPHVDPGRRDFTAGRFGLPMLAAVLWGTEWQYAGALREHIESFVHSDFGLVPGSHEAVLLEDAQRLLDSPLPDAAVTALWRSASMRWNISDEFDADGRTWLRQIVQVCSKRLQEVDPPLHPDAVASPDRAGRGNT